ncbi:MAG: TetR/AcrR family transcriptional regulator C-terminal domain-containing protein [Frankia sp.]
MRTGARSTRNRPAKAPLSRAAVVAAGLGVLRDEGLGAVTMRRVANALDTGPASLYVYVENRDELLRQMFDAVASTVHLPPIDPPRWREQLKSLLTASVEAQNAYPGIARVAIGSIPTGPASLAMAERVVTLLRIGGIGDQAAAWACDLLALFITAVAFETGVRNGPNPGPPEPADRSARATPGWQRQQSEIATLLEAIPAETYPTLSLLGGPMTYGSAAQRLDFGLDVLLNGLLATPVEP